MIRMVQGIYGYLNGRFVEPKTAKDTPFSLSPEQEARLVEMGVAAYVSENVGTKAAQGDAETAERKKTGEALRLPSTNKTKKVAELRAIAEAYGVDGSKCRTKDELCAALDAAFRAMEEAAKGAGDEIVWEVDGDDGDEEEYAVDATDEDDENADEDDNADADDSDAGDSADEDDSDEIDTDEAPPEFEAKAPTP